MRLRLGIFLIALMALNGCAKMKPIDFKDSKPQFILENYFSGKTFAWGIFEDRFGNLRRQFYVDITGTWNGTELVLDEQFVYNNGEHDQRVWTIKKIDAHTYQGRAEDIIGIAQGKAYGNALNWQYDMNLKIGPSTVRVHFNDWMFLQSPDVLLNRAKVSKFGIELGTVTLAFTKNKEIGVISGAIINERPPDALIFQEASR